MVPGISTGGTAGDAGRDPALVIVPDVPGVRALDVALGAENVHFAVHRLVDVELQRLRHRWRLDVEPEIVDEVLQGIVGAKLFPPKSGSIGRGASEEKLGGSAIHGRRVDALLHRVARARARSARAG